MKMIIEDVPFDIGDDQWLARVQVEHSGDPDDNPEIVILALENEEGHSAPLALTKQQDEEIYQYAVDAAHEAGVRAYEASYDDYIERLIDEARF